MDVPEPTIVFGVQDLFARYAHRIDRRDFDALRRALHRGRALRARPTTPRKAGTPSASSWAAS